MPGGKVLICQNGSCSAQGAQALVRDIEELASGKCEVEEWGCLGKCGKGPNIELQMPGGKSKVVEGVNNFKKAFGLLEKLDIDVDSKVKKQGKLKYELRREQDAGKRMEKIGECIEALGGEAAATKSEPYLLSNILVIRAKEYLKTQVQLAVKDAEKACQLSPTFAQAYMAAGNAYELMNNFPEAIKALTEAMNIGKGINKPAVKRQITRLERKAASAPAQAPAAEAPPAAATPTPAPAPAPEPAKAAPKKAATGASAKSKTKKTSSDGKAATAKKTSSDGKASDKKDRKEKDKEKESTAKIAVVPFDEPRSPLDFSEWSIESIPKLNHNCVVFRVKSLKPEVTSRDVNPGGIWHVDFLKEADEPGGEDLKRSYTPVTDFETYLKGYIDIMVKIYQDGLMTQYLDKLQVGSSLFICAPYATHSLEGCKELVILAGGSSVTVAIQLCQEALRLNPKDVCVQVIMCNNSVEDILYQDVFDRLLDKYPSMEMTNCISSGFGAKPPAAHERVVWQAGRVSKEVIKAKRGTQAIVSGPRGLCSAAKRMWKELDQDPELLSILDEEEPEECAPADVLERSGSEPHELEIVPPAAEPVANGLRQRSNSGLPGSTPQDKSQPLTA